jgi:hypothetical protein
MEAQSLGTQTIQMELGPLNEDFVRTAVTISRLCRGEWKSVLEVDYEAEVYRVTQELAQTQTFLTRGFGVIALRQEAERDSMRVGYGYAFESLNSLWFGGLNVVPEEVGNGVLPAIAQAVLSGARSNTMATMSDPHNVLPPLVAGALDCQEIREVPALSATPRIFEVQQALSSHPNLTEYDVKNT